MDKESGKRIIEAILFASGDPISLEKIQKVVKVPRSKIEQIIGELSEEYKLRSFHIIKVGNGYQVVTKPEYVDTVSKIRSRKTTSLSPQSLETLAIIVYKAPITRCEIEQIRGVNSIGVLNTLMERELIKITGKKGGFYLYNVTHKFYEYFKIDKSEQIFE